MLYTIKKLLGLTDNSKDELIQILIDQAQSAFTNYTHNNDLCGAETVISQMVVYAYNLLGSEALVSEGYSGVSFSYSQNYPAYILGQLNGFRRAMTL